MSLISLYVGNLASKTPHTGQRCPRFTRRAKLGFSDRLYRRCTRWLAQPAVHHALHDIWLGQATTWLVSDYLLMPDHLHLFCAPYDLKFTIEDWMTFWKSRLSKTCHQAGRFQRAGFHHRLRGGESYSQKWQYVRENPVRAGLTAKPEEWLYQGRVHEIRWHEPVK